MRKIFAFLFAVFALLTFAPAMLAETFTPPTCLLGNAPVKFDRKPTDGEWSFTAPKGGLVVMDFRTKGSSKVHQVLCRLPYDVLSWAPAPGTPGRPWDVVSGNNFDPVEWDIPVPEGFLQSLKGAKGDPGEVRVITNDGLNRAARILETKDVDFRVARRWHDPCTLTTTRKVVCTALAIGIGAGTAYALTDNNEPAGGCTTCRPY